MKRLFRGPATFWNQHYWNHFKLVVLPIAAIDVIADFINPSGLIEGPLRIAPILRPLIFTANVRSVRKHARSIRRYLETPTPAHEHPRCVPVI